MSSRTKQATCPTSKAHLRDRGGSRVQRPLRCLPLQVWPRSLPAGTWRPHSRTSTPGGTGYLRQRSCQQGGTFRQRKSRRGGLQEPQRDESPPPTLEKVLSGASLSREKDWVELLALINQKQHLEQGLQQRSTSRYQQWSITNETNGFGAGRGLGKWSS